MKKNGIHSNIDERFPPTANNCRLSEAKCDLLLIKNKFINRNEVAEKRNQKLLENQIADSNR